MSEIKAKCPLCSKESSTILTEKLRRGEGTVFKCIPCDHGFLEVHKDLNLKEYYAEDYRSEYSHKAESNSTDAKELFDTYVRFQDYRLTPILPFLSREKNLLEIGASSGQFIHHIKDKVSSVQAIELDKACHTFLTEQKGIDADFEYFEESKFKNNKYDIICSFQVLEHVPLPINFLKTIYNALNDGGVALIEVPNLHDPLISVWGIDSYHDFYYHSAHLQYFSDQSLKIVAEEAGFNVEKINFFYIQDYNILNHLNWVTNKTPQPTCEVGLNKINLNTNGNQITSWLESEMDSLNKKYISKLSETKSTSNILMAITKN